MLFPFSPPPSFPKISRSSLCCEVDSSTFFVSGCSFLAYSFSTASLATTSFFFYSARACASFRAASLFFCIAVDCIMELFSPLFVPTPRFVGLYHSVGQLPTISCTSVSDTKQGSLCHRCFGSLHVHLRYQIRQIVP